MAACESGLSMFHIIYYCCQHRVVTAVEQDDGSSDGNAGVDRIPRKDSKEMSLPALSRELPCFHIPLPVLI